MRNNKYNAVKTTINGIVFDSKREASRYQELLLLQRAGQIQDLKIQVPFAIVINGKKICKYIADFQYVDMATGKTVTEDSKGMATQVYKLKKRLVEALYNVKIVEV
jgi:enolase